MDNLRTLGFTSLRLVGNEVGTAAAIKIIRSIMVKGIEALTEEMMLAAEAAGIADEVLASLDASEQRLPWPERAAHNRERMSRHGLRRAAEMKEAIKTLLGLGVDPTMTRGTVRRQYKAARQPESAVKARGDHDH
jgi:3-hydroxyisobutyrate dehydrogenase-like beta-hydroxyacid dehydrogenase